MYKPEPINTKDIKLSKDVEELAELISENVHNVWAQKRIEEGWVYGENKDSIKKTTPCLVPYSELPELEKQYDRDTAYETLKLIVKLGYKITKEDK